MRNGKHGVCQDGFVYIGLLIGLAIIGLGLGVTSEVWTQSAQREKEVELLFVGNQIRQAITNFYLQSPPAVRRFPMTLDELVADARAPDKPQRFLRKLYTDPIGGGEAWGEIRLAGGQLVGVYSQSQGKPFKVAGFSQRDKALLGKESYSDWVFRSPLPAANPLLSPNGDFAAPGGPGATPVTQKPRSGPLRK
ncbi:type II secretion system protein [Actimicrobium sp. CCI2.3]|uniref:type II secretion system protein n=1 Tax=Actimicrobium sp. CCI2.3 TaxID=3048616 RepID=UPI002B247227|nr:type II secretion system protein [Actimicrobium sp. CCI2.3]MEB0023900.1 type II secretion system protein [Actimicrobium sp. CCI2.3]